MSTVQSSVFTATQTLFLQPQEPHSSFICPITNDIMVDPVIDKHGHTFEKAAITQWLKTKTTCPLNNQQMSSDELAPNRALKEIIESYQAPSPQGSLTQDDKTIPHPSAQVQNDALSAPLLTNAQDLENKNKLQDAEQLYLIALQFTSKSEDYAHLPRLFEKKGEKERAAKAHIVLADLQITEGKKPEAIASLKTSLQLKAQPSIKEKLAHLLNETGQKQEAALLFLELAQQALYNKDTLRATTLCNEALQAFPGHAETWKTLAALQNDTTGTVKTLLKGANEPTMPLKDRLEICKTITLKDPDNLQAELLFLKLNQLKMKNKIKQLKQIDDQKIQNLERTLKELLSEKETRLAKKEEKLRIAEQVKALEAQKVQQLQKEAVPDIAFGKAAWAKHFGDVGVEPPLPPNIEQLLNGPCPIWQGKTVRETHLLVLVPQTVNGQPLTLKLLGELVQKPLQGNATKYRSFYLGEYKDPPAPASHWALVTRDVLPGSRSKPYAEQQKIAQGYSGYQVPTILDATTAILMEYVRSGTRLYGDNPWTYTRSQEKYNKNWQLIVGGFSAAGLLVNYYRDDGEYVGVGGLRKF